MARVTFKVDTDRLKHDADYMSSDIKAIKTAVNDANDDIVSLGAMWKGKANTELTESFNVGYQWMIDSLSKFESYARALVDDANRYEIGESKALDLAHNV